MTATIKYKQSFGELIADDLIDFWLELIYYPLVGAIKDDLPQTIKLNAKELPETYLKQRLSKGEIVYDGKYFYGALDAKTSKILKSYGAQWDSTKKAFKLTAGKMPVDLKTAVSISAGRLKTVNSNLQMTLNKAENEMPHSLANLDLSKSLNKIIDDLTDQAMTATAAMQVQFTLTDGMKKKLSEDYTENMKLYIKDWTETHIKDLRDDVEKNSMEGFRYDKLITSIENRYDVTKSKAKFLARQETSLFMSKFRRERFLDSGAVYYRWSTSKDQRVRLDHKKLDGKIFMFGEPPVVDTSTGRRAEPGEDYGCRCLAIPIVATKIRKVHGEYVIIS